MDTGKLKKGLKSSPYSLLKSEKVGFEPTVQIAPHNTLAGCRLKPTRPLFHSGIRSSYGLLTLVTLF